MDLGADDYLTKIVEGFELLSAIESRQAKAALLSKIIDSASNKEADGPIRDLNNLKKN